jgi:hypothetical protein
MENKLGKFVDELYDLDLVVVGGRTVSVNFIEQAFEIMSQCLVDWSWQDSLRNLPLIGPWS